MIEDRFPAIRLLHIVLLAFLLSGVPSARALADERRFSLAEALRYSLRENPELRAFNNGLLGRKEEIGIARSFLLPKITFEERFMRTNNPTYAFMAKLNQRRFTEQDFAVSSLNEPPPVNDFQTALSFEQPIFAPAAWIGVNMAETEFTAKGAEMRRKKEEVVFGVFKAFLGVQTARSFVAVAEKGIEDAKEHLRIAESRYDASLGLYSDVLRARVSLSSAEEAAVSAAKNLAVAKRALGLMLGLSESADADDGRPSMNVRKLDEYYSASLSREDLKSAEARSRNAANSLKLADAGYLPVLGIGGSFQMNDHSMPLGSEGDSWQLTAFLRWQLFDGTRREHERNKAKFAASEAEEQLAGFRKQVSFMVYDAFLGVEAWRKRLELAKTSLESAEEGRRLVRTRYENSLATLVDLIDAQMSLDSARAEVVERESGYLTAIASLGFQSGTLLADLGLEK